MRLKRVLIKEGKVDMLKKYIDKQIDKKFNHFIKEKELDDWQDYYHQVSSGQIKVINYEDITYNIICTTGCMYDYTSLYMYSCILEVSVGEQTRQIMLSLKKVDRKFNDFNSIWGS